MVIAVAVPVPTPLLLIVVSSAVVAAYVLIKSTYWFDNDHNEENY